MIHEDLRLYKAPEKFHPVEAREFVNWVDNNLNFTDRSLIFRALGIAKTRHIDEVRKTLDENGEEIPFITHPIAVTQMALAFGKKYRLDQADRNSFRLLGVLGLMHDTDEASRSKDGKEFNLDHFTTHERTEDNFHFDPVYTEDLEFCLGIITKSKFESTVGYFSNFELLDAIEPIESIKLKIISTIVKMLDRYHNLSTPTGNIDKDNNKLEETRRLLMPIFNRTYIYFSLNKSELQSEELFSVFEEAFNLLVETTDYNSEQDDSSDQSPFLSSSADL